VDEDGRILVYDEHYQSRQLIGWHANEIKRRPGSYAWTVSDHDAQDVAELRQQGIATIPAKKDVTLGIQRTMARLDVQPDGRPRLRIHERCVNLIREIGLYQWAGARAGAPNREEPVKEHDHAMDALRYLVMQIDGGGRPRVTWA
jgi:phage terminase large subunit